ncbi:MAG: hypothetical protein LBT73_00210 [Tannerellaceae bacterium]|jgi:hypothetical protein|nr:hypothetical protein [Tannerellaceae bacterium]
MKKFAVCVCVATLMGAMPVGAEKYHFTISPQQDTIVVYDASNNAVLQFAKDFFVYRNVPITVTKEKKKFVFSSMGKKFGVIASKRCKKVYLFPGTEVIGQLSKENEYLLVSKKKNLSYKQAGKTYASAGYTFNSTFPQLVGNRVDVEMNVNTDLNFVPLLFHSVLVHIQKTNAAEKASESMFWWTLGVLTGI